MFKVKMLNKFDNRSLAWLMSAASTDESRPVLANIAQKNGNLVTCDGFRIHSVPLPTSLRDAELPDVFKPLDTIKLSSKVVNFEANGDYPFPDTDQNIPTTDPIKVFSVNLKFLRDAISQCPTPKDVIVPLRFTIRKDHGPVELTWGMSEVLLNGETDTEVKRRHTAYIMPVHDDKSMDAETNGNPSEVVERLQTQAQRQRRTIEDCRAEQGLLKATVADLRGQLNKAQEDNGHVDTKEWVSRESYEAANKAANALVEEKVQLKREVRKLQAAIPESGLHGTRLDALTEFLGVDVIDRIAYVCTNSNGDLTIQNDRLEAEKAQLNEQLEAIKAALS